MKVGKNKARKVTKQTRSGNGYNQKEKVKPIEEDSILLAGSVWKTTDIHDHNILVYPDLRTYRKIYSESSKHALDNNEIVLLVTTYDSFDRIKDSLRQVGIPVDNETKEGNLIILDAVKAYQIDTYGAAKFITTLAKRAETNGKAGVFALTEMGSFFIAERIATLLEYEASLPKQWGLHFKSACTYHKDDLASLSREQQDIILSAHNRVLH